MKTKKKSYISMTVMLDLDVLDTSGDGCSDCRTLGEGRCESCRAWLERTGQEIERRAEERFPGCRLKWMSASEMGTFKAANPNSVGCPDDIYQAVLGN